MKKYIITIIAAIAMYGCDNKKPESVKKTIDIETICDDLMGSSIAAVAKMGSYSIWQDFRGDTALHIVDTKAKREIASMCKIGQGPDEFIMPWFSVMDTNNIFIMDLQTQKYSWGNLNDKQNGKPYIKPCDQNILNTIGEGTYDKCIALGTDEFIFMGSILPEKPFVHVKGDTRNTFGEYPVEGAEYGGSAFQGFIAYNKHKNTMVYTTMMFPYMAIYEQKDGVFVLKNKTSENTDFVNDNDNIRTKGNHQGAYYMTITQDYIVTIENEDKTSTATYKPEDNPNTLFVRDYDGNTLYIADLGCPIISIGGDETNNEIYAIVLNPEYTLIKCTLQ